MGIRTIEEVRISQTDNILRNIKDELHDMNHGIKNLTDAIKSLDDAYRFTAGLKTANEARGKKTTDDMSFDEWNRYFSEDPNEAKGKTVSADDVLHMLGGPGYRAGGPNDN